MQPTVTVRSLGRIKPVWVVCMANSKKEPFGSFLDSLFQTVRHSFWLSWQPFSLSGFWPRPSWLLCCSSVPCPCLCSSNAGCILKPANQATRYAFPCGMYLSFKVKKVSGSQFSCRCCVQKKLFFPCVIIRHRENRLYLSQSPVGLHENRIARHQGRRP